MRTNAVDRDIFPRCRPRHNDTVIVDIAAIRFEGTVGGSREVEREIDIRWRRRDRVGDVATLDARTVHDESCT